MSTEKEVVVITSSLGLQAVAKDKGDVIEIHSSVLGLTGTDETHDIDEPGENDLPSAVPYTVYTRDQKRQLRLLSGFATITSPLTANIYMPLLPLLRTQFQTSAQAINLTLTIYIIFQALSAAIFGPLSDSAGRRLVYFATLSLYVLGNLGLALNRSNYAALLILRAVQSLGASAALSVSYGVIADICVPSERGMMLGPVSMAVNLGSCVGPVIGGSVAYTSSSHRWVFWFLVIVGVLLWLFVGFFLPETARSLVGNGSPDARRCWWEKSWFALTKHLLFHKKQNVKLNNPSDKNQSEITVPPRKPFLSLCRVANPLACLRVVFHRDTFLVTSMQGSFYMIDIAIAAAMPDIYKDSYHFNELQIGLTYIPRGFGIVAGGYCTGKLIDYNYRVVAKKIGWKIDKVVGDDLLRFPIEQARSRGSYSLVIASTAILVTYGWATAKHAPLAIVLILQFFQAAVGMCFYNIYGALLVDIFPESPSTAAAAASIVRCTMAATGVAILEPLLKVLGRAWYFTTLGIWSGVFGAVTVLIIQKKGMAWRTQRIIRKRERDAANCS